MPSLWKRDKSPYWVCCYTSADGQRLKKSTKQTDRKRAWEVCLSIYAPDVSPRMEVSQSRRQKKSSGKLSSERPANLCTTTRGRLVPNGDRQDANKVGNNGGAITSRLRAKPACNAPLWPGTSFALCPPAIRRTNPLSRNGAKARRSCARESPQ